MNTNNSTIGAEEYEALQGNEISEEDVKRMFMSRFKFEHNPNGGYKPKEEADYLKSRPYIGYYINYTFPQNSNKPVASVWTTYKEDGEDRFKIFHINLDAFTTMVINDLRRQGFNPPPPLKPGTYQKPINNVAEDDKPF